MVAADHYPPVDDWTVRRVALIMAVTKCSRIRALTLVEQLLDAAGPIEATIRSAVAQLEARAPLSGAQATYAHLAYRLARQLDQDVDEGSTGLAGISREIRAAMDAIWKGVKVPRDSDSFAEGLATPDR